MNTLPTDICAHCLHHFDQCTCEVEDVPLEDLDFDFEQMITQREERLADLEERIASLQSSYARLRESLLEALEEEKRPTPFMRRVCAAKTGNRQR